MAKLQYKLKFTKRDNNAIYFRYIDGRDLDVTLKTPIDIPQNVWSSKKQEVSSTFKLYEQINSKLTSFRAFLIEERIKAKLNGVLMNKAWVTDKAAEFFKTQKKGDRHKFYLLDYVQYYIEHKKIAPSTKRAYNTILTRVKKYSEHKDKTFRIREVTKTFLEDFEDWMTGEQYASETISTTVKKFTQFIDNAGDDIIINPSYKKYKYEAPVESTITDIYLDAQEIKLIEQYRPKEPFLVHARQIFLVGLSTGLRISDLMRINSKVDVYRKGVILPKPRIEDNNLIIIALKTGKKCTIPLQPKTIDLYNNFKPMVEPKFNERIKIIGKRVGINKITYGKVSKNINAHLKGSKAEYRDIEGEYKKYELISSHTQRRSYVSNRVRLGDDLGSIRAATGHGTDSQLLDYVKITQKEYANFKHDQWEKEKK